MGLFERQMRAEYSALRAGAEAAKKYFEKHADFPAIQVSIADGIEALKHTLSPSSAIAHATPERLSLVTDVLDIRAGAYLRLVEDMDSQKSYETLVASFGLRAIEDYSGYSSAEVHFTGETPSEKHITTRVQHWKMEGYRRLKALRETSKELTELTIVTPRRGYRIEVRAWMVANGVATITDAARILGISETTLKSIMSDVGEQRYGPDTLDRVLKTILPNGE